MNPLRAGVSQSKRFFALLHDPERCPVSVAPDALQHIPVTTPVDAVADDQLAAEKDRWGAQGRVGSDGRHRPDRKASFPGSVGEGHRGRPRRVIHSSSHRERFDVSPVWIDDGVAYPTIGVYLVNGRFAGYYTRVDRTPFIHYDSPHVPTLVEAHGVPREGGLHQDATEDRKPDDFRRPDG